MTQPPIDVTIEELLNGLETGVDDYQAPVRIKLGDRLGWITAIEHKDGTCIIEVAMGDPPGESGDRPGK